MRFLNFRRPTRLLVGLTTLVMAAAASALLASPAQAESGSDSGDHCMIVLPKAEIVQCFDTFEEARRFAENAGAIGPSKEGPGGSQARPAQAGGTGTRAAAALTLLSIEYDWTFWNPVGGTRWVYGTSGPCSGPTTDVDYQLPDWAPHTFDQRISSFQTFNNCWAKHYDLVNYGGLAVGYQGSQAVINAAITNDSSSERWS